MTATNAHLPFPTLDALPMGAHRISMLTDEALAGCVGVRIGFCGREGGVSTGPYASLNCKKEIGDDDGAVDENCRRVMEAVGASGCPLVVPNQVHGDAIVSVTDVSKVEDVVELAGRGADGVLVGVPGVMVLLNSADCLLLIVVSPSGRFVVAHAGWRGAVAGIASKAVEKLAREDAAAGFSARGGAHEFNAYLGPHICAECFEVGREVSEKFEERFGRDVLLDDCHVDLGKAVSVDLMRAGLSESRIVDSGQCTMCHPDIYFSYRAAGGTCGRIAAVAFRQ